MRIRKKAMAQVWGTMASGIMFRNRGRIFLQLRSGNVDDPGLWGIPGGALKGTEGFYQSKELEEPNIDEQLLLDLWYSAMDEVTEETGCDFGLGEGRFRQSQKIVNREDNFIYVTFIVDVTDEEAIRLKKCDPEIEHEWESSGHKWHGLQELPKGLHPGVEYVMKQTEPFLVENASLSDAHPFKTTEAAHKPDSQWTQGQVYDDGEKIYDIEALEKILENNTVTKAKIKDLVVQLHNKEAWAEGDRKCSPMMVMINPTFNHMNIKHMTRIRTADLDKPILIRFSNGEVIDGYHRLSKAFLAGEKYILAKYVQKSQLEEAVFSED